MTNDEVASGLIRQASERLQHAKLALGDLSFAFAYRLSQECVELSLKAVLLRAGIDPPKWHDVGEVLLKNRRKIPGLTEANAREVASISKELRRDRERAMYGDDIQKLPPQALFDEKTSSAAVADADKAFSVCDGLLKSA